MSMSKNNQLYCSQCKFSAYVTIHDQKRLFCQQRKAFGQTPYLPTDCTNAESCLEFRPERWRDNLTTRKDYVSKMKKCKIPLFTESLGRLRREKLTK